MSLCWRPCHLVLYLPRGVEVEGTVDGNKITSSIVHSLWTVRVWDTPTCTHRNTQMTVVPFPPRSVHALLNQVTIRTLKFSDFRKYTVFLKQVQNKRAIKVAVTDEKWHSSRMKWQGSSAVLLSQWEANLGPNLRVCCSLHAKSQSGNKFLPGDLYHCSLNFQSQTPTHKTTQWRINPETHNTVKPKTAGVKFSMCLVTQLFFLWLKHNIPCVDKEEWGHFNTKRNVPLGT